MITFGYKNKFSGFARAALALILGAVMFFTGNSVTIIVQIIAAFILASGVVSLIIGLKKENQNQKSLVVVNTGFNILIAVLMFIFAESLGGLIVAIVGIILVLFGLFQLIVLFSASRVAAIGKVAFVMPLVVLACGALLLFKPGFIENALGYIVGASLIIYGISELVSTWKMQQTISGAGAQNGTSAKSAPTASEKLAEAFKDVEYEKVDEQ
jgi:uncharacterized membrane protein HdeD (DUF308 family)